MSTSFVCLVCSHRVNEAVQRELREKIAALKIEQRELSTALKDSQQNSIAPIVAEISELHSAVQQAKNHNVHIPAIPQRCFSEAAKGNRIGAKPQRVLSTLVLPEF